jgi:hypothetical protein
MHTEGNLQERMKAAAEDAVRWADTGPAGVKRALDYSPQSLVLVNSMFSLFSERKDLFRGLKRWLRENSSKTLSTIFGAYVGETYRRANGGDWVLESSSSATQEPIICLRNPDGSLSPIVMMFDLISHLIDKGEWPPHLLGECLRPNVKREWIGRAKNLIRIYGSDNGDTLLGWDFELELTNGGGIQPVHMPRRRFWSGQIVERNEYRVYSQRLEGIVVATEAEDRTVHALIRSNINELFPSDLLAKKEWSGEARQVHAVMERGRMVGWDFELHSDAGKVRQAARLCGYHELCGQIVDGNSYRVYGEQLEGGDWTGVVLVKFARDITKGSAGSITRYRDYMETDYTER